MQNVQYTTTYTCGNRTIREALLVAHFAEVDFRVGRARRTLPPHADDGLGATPVALVPVVLHIVYTRRPVPLFPLPRVALIIAIGLTLAPISMVYEHMR